MTIADVTRSLAVPDRTFGMSGNAPELPRSPHVNVGESERTVSLSAGAILAVFGLTRQSVPGLIMAGVGGAMLYRGFTGHCHMYGALGIDSATDEARALHVEQAFLINRSPEDLYSYWRDLTNLPKIMTHLESVTVIDDKRSHWVAHGPRLIRSRVEWDAEIVRDEPNRSIAWRSIPGAEVDNSGEVRFSRAPGDRGTEVHVTMKYAPPAGRLGQIVATLSGENPNKQIREDLRNFKRFMELGEAPTTVGQSHGTCTGRGIRSPATGDSILPNA